MPEYLVFGPPGTGKTHYLTGQIKRAAEKHGPESLLIGSLTRTAAREIAGRAIGEAGVERAQVGTLHAICYRLAGQPPLADTKEGRSAWNDWLPSQHGSFKLSESGSALIDAEETSQGATLGDELKSSMDLYRARRELDRSRWRMDVQEFADLWDQFRAEAEYWDFTELIEDAVDGRLRPPDGATIGFFDEVQDFSRLEHDLLRTWAKYLDTVISVGDEDQAIYAWRGACPEAMIHHGLPKDNVRILKQSHRLREKVLKFSQEWIKHELRGERMEKDFMPREAGGSVQFSSGGRVDPGTLVDEIESCDGSAMVLASCSYMLQPVTAELRTRGIPFHNPYRPEAGAWNPMRGGAARLEAFLREEQTWETAWQWRERLDARRTGLVRSAKSIAKAQARGQDSRRWRVPPSELAGLFKTGLPELSVGWLRERLLQRGQKLLSYAFEVFDRHGAEALRRRPRVSLGTIHSVKGGQADHVFLLPDLSPGAIDDRAGTARVMYVGITRARESVTIATGMREARSASLKDVYIY